MMDFYEVLEQALVLLQRHGRVSYRALKRQFDLDDDYLDDLKSELIEVQQCARDQDGRMLVWAGDTSITPETNPPSAPSPSSPLVNDPNRDPASYTPQHLAEKILTGRSVLEGERKQVTVLFCDLANSTPIAEKIGPEAMHGLLNRFFELALNDVHRYEGTINQFLGDGFMSLFGAPISHEDHARRGVLAALALQQRLKEAHLGGPYGVECSFRMGLNSGLVVVGSIGDNLRMDYSAIGDTTNLASRLQGVAEPGHILVSEHTGRLVQGDIRLEPLEPVAVKGKTEPVSAYKVIGALRRRSPMANRDERALSAFVGRERELAILDELFKQVKSGQGQIVGIVAEAGQGKSRLLYEFRQRLHDKQVTYLEGRCLSYGSGIPYHPIVDAVRSNCAITENESSETVTEKVRFALQAVGMDPAESAPYILHLLGVREGIESFYTLTPETVRTRTFDTLKQMSLKGSQQRPLIFEIEDLHWIDKTSEDYLAALVESLTGASIFLLTSYRPGYRPPWIGKSYATQISLHSLAPQDALNVIHSIRRDTPLPEHLEQTIIGKAEGNPFFLEELTRAVIDHGDPENDIDVPDTVQGVLMARIDRLPEEPKRLLQTASVLGRAFSLQLLQEIWEGSDSLDPLLAELTRLEFLFERSEAEGIVYVFRHALTQEVAYESLLTARRQVIHAAAGQALERLHHDWLSEHYEELAYHFSLGEVWKKAFDYLVNSGDKARQAYANQEAIMFYTQAIEVSERIVPPLDESQRLPIYEGRGLVRLLLTRYDEAIADFERMYQIACTTGQSHHAGESLCHLATAHYHQYSADHLPLVEQYTQEALRLAQQTGNHAVLAQALTSLGSVCVAQGNFPEGERKFTEAVQISRREGFKNALSKALTLLCGPLYWQGKFQAVPPLAQEGIAVSRDISDGFHELFCLAFLCQSLWGCGDYEQALAVLQEASTKAQERQIPFFISRMGNTRGWFYREFNAFSHAVACDQESAAVGREAPMVNAEISALVNLGLDYLGLGQLERARSQLTSTLERIQHEGTFGAHRWRWSIKLFLGLAELAHRIGNAEQALRYVEEGIKTAEFQNSQKYMAFGWALRGKIVATFGDAEMAGTDLKRAFSLANQLQSPSLIYPIAYDLSQWHESTGKEREAASLCGNAKATIEQMVTAVRDETLRSALLQSERVQEIHEHARRLGG